MSVPKWLDRSRRHWWNARKWDTKQRKIEDERRAHEEEQARKAHEEEQAKIAYEAEQARIAYEEKQERIRLAQVYREQLEARKELQRQEDRMGEEGRRQAQEERERIARQQQKDAEAGFKMDFLDKLFPPEK